MAQLREMRFGVRENRHGTIDSMHSVLEHHDDVKHDAVVGWVPDGAHIVCSCGSRWFIHASKLCEAEIRATFNSHLSYYSRKRLTPD